MGLIRAFTSAVSGVIGDQWKEFFYCDAMPSDVLVKRAFKKTGGVFNNFGNDNIITNGSGIAVADGQCMMIVEQGEIVEVCAVPGEFIYDTSTEPSIFTGDLNSAIEETFRKVGRRFSYGGAPAKDQRVYYFNIKELRDNKFGTPNPIPFRVVDSKIGLDLDVDIRCSGVYSYKIVDPLLFYTNVCGNVERNFTREDIDTQLKAEFVNALAPALGEVAKNEIRPSQLTEYYDDITEALNKQLSKLWKEARGLEIVSIALNPITLTEHDSERLKAAQNAAVYANPAMAAANISQAQAEAMVEAARNDAGAAVGFMGMGMAMNSGGSNPADLFAIGQANAAAEAKAAEAKAAEAAAAEVKEAAASEAQQSAFAVPAIWHCPSCGKMNDGNYCTNCGTKKPDELPHCKNCGFVPKDPTDLPNYCPQCGTKFEK